jgi:hypothetical protein
VRARPIQRCIGEPISWLRLERFHAGEGGAAERDAVAAHVAACAACAACLATIREGDGVALPPLPAARKKSARVVPWMRGRIAVAVTALAAAAALVVGLRGHPGDEGRRATGSARVKGGTIAFSLVREDGARIDGDDGVYRDGDRFMALVTCPPGGDVSVDLRVEDDAGVSWPIPAPAGFGCGNEVPLGALRLRGATPERICLVWSEEGRVERSAANGPMLCKTLAAATRE